MMTSLSLQLWRLFLNLRHINKLSLDLTLYIVIMLFYRVTKHGQNARMKILVSKYHLIVARWVVHRRVFEIKSTYDGPIHKHKAYLVAKSFTQIPGIDCTDFFNANSLTSISMNLVQYLHWQLSSIWFYIN